MVVIYDDSSSAVSIYPRCKAGSFVFLVTSSHCKNWIDKYFCLIICLIAKEAQKYFFAEIQR